MIYFTACDTAQASAGTSMFGTSDLRISTLPYPTAPSALPVQHAQPTSPTWPNLPTLPTQSAFSAAERDSNDVQSATDVPADMPADMPTDMPSNNVITLSQTPHDVSTRDGTSNSSEAPPKLSGILMDYECVILTISILFW